MHRFQKFDVLVAVDEFFLLSVQNREWKRRKEMIDKRVLKNTELLLSCMIKIAEEGIEQEEDSE